MQENEMTASAVQQQAIALQGTLKRVIADKDKLHDKIGTNAVY